jgi:hypothetical protein
MPHPNRRLRVDLLVGQFGLEQPGYVRLMAGFQVTEVQKALKGADYPMDGAALADLAKSNGADQELQGLREVEGPNGVMKELKGSLGGSTDDS